MDGDGAGFGTTCPVPEFVAGCTGAELVAACGAAWSGGGESVVLFEHPATDSAAKTTNTVTNR